ncbi:MAG: hypothetical protein IKS22_05565 [Bacteroidales bacterium]|nr:hypothetical protein [Bacteroidales bacterium]
MREMIFFDTPLPFGKHKGELYGQTDYYYREWLKTNVHSYMFMDMTSKEYEEQTKNWQIWYETDNVNDRLSFSTKESAIAYLEKKGKTKAILEAIDRIKYKGCKWIWISHGWLML